MIIMYSPLQSVNTKDWWGLTLAGLPSPANVIQMKSYTTYRKFPMEVALCKWEEKRLEHYLQQSLSWKSEAFWTWVFKKEGGLCGNIHPWDIFLFLISLTFPLKIMLLLPTLRIYPLSLKEDKLPLWPFVHLWFGPVFPRLLLFSVVAYS